MSSKTPGDAPDPFETDSPSRTQRKRQALDLQKIGEQLLALDDGDLAQVPVPQELSDAIATWKRIRSHEARRRQSQFIGKLMRRIDLEPVEAALARLDGQSAEARYAFHQLERWRDRLAAEPAALTEYLDEHPQADRQALRHQLKKVAGARDEQQRKVEARALFRLLRAFEETGA